MASKKELLEQTKVVEEAIAEEMSNLQENILRKVKLGLTIAFIGFGTYWILKKYLDYPVQYQDLKPNTQENEPREESKIVSSGEELDIVQMIKKEIAVFLLAIAKQKIYELLQKFYDTQNIEQNEEDTK